MEINDFLIDNDESIQAIQVYPEQEVSAMQEINVWSVNYCGTVELLSRSVYVLTKN